jgi:hypothetical protein
MFERRIGVCGQSLPPARLWIRQRFGDRANRQSSRRKPWIVRRQRGGSTARSDRSGVLRGLPLFSIIPQYDGETWTEAIPPIDGQATTFCNDVAQAEIECLIGIPVQVPKPTECRAVDLGGKGRPLLALQSRG